MTNTVFHIKYIRYKAQWKGVRFSLQVEATLQVKKRSQKSTFGYKQMKRINTIFFLRRNLFFLHMFWWRAWTQQKASVANQATVSLCRAIYKISGMATSCWFFFFRAVEKKKKKSTVSLKKKKKELNVPSFKTTVEKEYIWTHKAKLILSLLEVCYLGFFVRDSTALD